MPKLVGLFKRRGDLSLAEFRDYYENHHAPFNVEHFGTFMAGYTRSYIDHTTPYLPAGQETDLRFDVVTEIVFVDDDAMKGMFSSAATQPGLVEAIAADEAEFMDREVTQLYIVSDQTSSMPTPG